MKPHTFSPDGKWMWDGDEWIPSPPEHSPRNVAELESSSSAISQNIIHESLSDGSSQVIIESKTSAAPLIGTVAIFFSLFLPYISVIDIFEVSGYEMIREIVNSFDLDVSETGNYENYDETVDSNLIYSLAVFLFVFSPLVFLASASISGLITLGNGTTKLIGMFHVIYSVTFFVAVFLFKSQNPYTDMIFFEIVGEGFYLGAFAGILLMLD